ncbi:hypothetical protein B0T20DRAFT_102877 [Sordaria brevicollis]|uniref:Very long-chain fatty acid transport protein n=1 Tax=Sordaria brevicollis TaxID=83679 RepID=A0AAE0NUZ5_SORBR|nr:hypothetical protein B0T20DRAFT_102877 [Sordaria brevicollis]
MPAPLSLAGAAAAAATTAAVTSYLSASLSLEHDLLWFRIAGSTALHLVRSVRAGQVNIFYRLEAHALSPLTATKPFLWFEGKSYTYYETYQQVLRWGTWFREVKGVKKGEVVAVMAMNSDMFVFVWFGLWSIGATPAFVNYNLSGRPLAHSLGESRARLVVVDPVVVDNLTEEVKQQVKGGREEKGHGMEYVVLGPETEAERFRLEPKRYPDEVRRVDSYVGMAILIYTSGTTGLPKPAVVSWMKVFMAAMLTGKGTEMRGDDVLYTCMPLYHSSASCLGVCAALFRGATVAIGRKFSTKTFWKDVRASNATIIQYVGETCRYLTVAEPEIDPQTGKNLDREHKVRVACGNGLRPDVWERFKERFGVDTILEFYASTEGPLGTWNRSRNAFSLGAIGRFGLLSHFLTNLRSAVVRLDFESDQPWRDPTTGFCKRTRVNEPGELLAALPADDIKSRFQGYYGNEKATNSKILRDVFKRGDAWFRTGDIVHWDSERKLYFSDRIGDTFRWKSENVSTAEVSQAMGTHPAVQEANVYGVQLPNHDGRAGCAAVSLKGLGQGGEVSEEILESLARHATRTLPRYAVPLFLRVVKEVGGQTTGTMKQQKHVLRQEGVEPGRVTGRHGDGLFWLDGKRGRYVKFGEREWRELEGGRVKL